METSINERIRELITHLGIKDNKFAEITGIPPTTLSNYFKRGSEPNIATFIMIINSFEFLNPIWLLTGKEQMFKVEKSELGSETKDVLMKTIIQLSGENALLKERIKRLEDENENKYGLVAEKKLECKKP